MYAVQIGQVANFKFHEDLHLLNGPYKVQALLQHTEMEAFTTDPVQSMYVACNKMQLYMDKQLHLEFQRDVYYKLVSILDDTKVYHVPETLIVEVPMVGIKKHYEVMMTVNLGVYKTPEDLRDIKTLIEATLHAEYGITNPAKIVVFNEAWLTDEDYQKEVDIRALNRQTVDNFYVSYRKALAQVVRLQNEVAAYEEALIKMSAVI